MNNLIRSILKTAVYFLDQTDRFTGNMRDRVADGADRVSDIRDRAVDVYEGPSHHIRHLLVFTAGVGVGMGAAILFAPASGQETRNQIGNKVEEFRGRVRDRVKDRFSSATSGATGTEGM